METFLIQQEIGTDLTFIGQEIASVASTPVQTDSECYSGYINESVIVKIVVVFSHAALSIVLSPEASVFSGLSHTSATGRQFLVSPLHRFGLRSFAAA
jgi:hypothetical protein